MHVHVLVKQPKIDVLSVKVRFCGIFAVCKRMDVVLLQSDAESCFLAAYGKRLHFDRFLLPDIAVLLKIYQI